MGSFTNNEDLDEMPHNAAFQNLHVCCECSKEWPR